MSNHPQADNSRPDRDPDPAAPPPSAPDGADQVSGQPWSTPSGDPLSADPFRPASPYQPPQAYQPGYAAVPAPSPEYPPTSQFPPVNYAPPGQAPDYGQGYPPPGQPPGQPLGYGTGQPPGYESGPPPPYGLGQPPGHGPGQPPGYGTGQPPGYPPGPPPGYPPPGYPPAGPPPRRSNTPLIAVIVAVSLLLCGGVATATVLAFRAAANKAQEVVEPITELPTIEPELPGLPTGLPTGIPGSGRKITVTYEVTGDGPAQILYVDKVGGAPTRLNDVKLPWRFEVEAETPTLLSVIAMRVENTDGEISCRALVDGAEVKQRTSSTGRFATASCTHFALE